MQWLVEVGLSNAFAAAALAMVAWILGRIGRRPALTHAVWLLVLIKLLTPPIFELPMPIAISRTAVFRDATLGIPEPSGVAQVSHERHKQSPIEPPPIEGIGTIKADNNSLPAAHSALEPQHSHSADTEAIPMERAPSATSSSNVGSTPPDSISLASTPSVIDRPHTPFWTDWRQLAATVWLFGVAVWLVLQAALGVRLRSVLRATAPAPIDLRDSARQIAQHMGLRKCPQVRIVAGTGSPMLCGLGRRATIVIPAALLRRLGSEAQATVLAHELAHYARGDQWVRLLEILATGLYWWLPIVWWARRQIEIAEEQCCDAHVLETFSDRTRVYAEALLDIVDLISEPPRRMRPAMSSGIGHGPLLKKRLVDLMSQHCKPAMTPLARRAILVAGAGFLLWHPVIFVNKTPAALAAMANAGASTIRLAFAELAKKVSTRASELPEDVASPAPELTQDLAPPQPGDAERNVWATAIAPNGRYHITVSRGYECELREVTSNQVRSLSGHRITCVAFASDSKRFVTGDLHGFVRLWDAASGDVLQTLTTRNGPVYSVCMAPLTDHVVAAGEDGLVEVVNTALPSDRQVLARLDTPVRCARFSPMGTRLAVVTDTWKTASASKIRVYDIVSRARLLQWDAEGPLGAVNFPSEDRIISVEWSGRTRQWTLPDLYVENLPPIAKELASAASFSADTRVLEDVAHHHDGR